MRRALHGWARASLSKDQVIRGLQDMKASGCSGLCRVLLLIQGL
jgi:hypothetical protein